MATIRRTITITGGQDTWIRAQIEAGRYKDYSELIADLIRRERARDVDVGSIRRALAEGEESGEPRRFDAAAFQRRMLDRRGATRGD